MSDTTSSTKSGPLQKLGPKGIGAIVLAILVVVFIAENGGKTKIRFIAGPKVSAPLWLALLIAGVVGAAITWLYERRHQK